MPTRPQQSPCDLSKWVILLTTAVHINVTQPAREKNTSIAQVRLALYNEAFKHWWTKTVLDLVIVESSGYTFDEIRSYASSLKIDSFKIRRVSQVVLMAEAYSIIHAFKHHYLDKYDYVLKVTGKYFLPEVEEHLCSLNATSPNFDLLIQNKPPQYENVTFTQQLLWKKPNLSTSS